MLEILQSLLAFAVTMLALATLVTVILELLARFLKRRQRILAQMLARVFDEEISPLVDARLARLGVRFAETPSVPATDGLADGLADGGATPPLSFPAKLWAWLKKLKDESRAAARRKAAVAAAAQDAVAVREKFVDDVRQSRFRPDERGTWLVRLGVKLSTYFSATQSNEMTREEFIRRVAVSEMGPQIAELGDNADAFVERLGVRYDEMAAGAREYMKNSSAVLSLIIGIVVALALNVDAHRLLKYYLDHPSVSAGVARDAEKYAANYEAARDKLDATLKDLEAAPVDPADPAAADAETKRLKADIEAAKKLLTETPSLGGLTDLTAFPIGAAYYPHCRFSDPTDSTVVVDPRCFEILDLSCGVAPSWFCRNVPLFREAVVPASAVVGEVLFTWKGLAWLLTTILTGVLIGIGGPFWYDAVKGLMRATQLLRGRTDAAENETKKGGVATGSPAEIFRANVGTPAPVSQPYDGPLWRPRTPDDAVPREK